MPVKPIRDKWPGTMTDRQRFVEQMHYRPHDRCFNMEFGYWNDNFDEWDIFVENGINDNREADAFFSFDKIEGFTGTIWMHPTFTETVISETDSTIIKRNQDGLLAEIRKDGKSTIPHYHDSSVKTPDDWMRIKEKRFNRDAPDRQVDIKAVKESHPPDRDYPLGVNCGSMIGRIRNMLTFEGLAYAVFDYPEMVEDMVETACLLTENMLDQVLNEIDFDFASGWEDICFKNGPIISLDFFNHVVVPRYKRIGCKLQDAGIDIWYTDCDGDVRALLPGFLASGINCLFPYEVNSCAHPWELLQEYGEDLRIMGGVDKMELARGPDAIKIYLESLVPAVERGGYIPFCDHRCPPNVKPEYYLYYLDLKKEMFGQ